MSETINPPIATNTTTPCACAAAPVQAAPVQAGHAQPQTQAVAGVAASAPKPGKRNLRKRPSQV